ncbi:prolyl aminopeptidase [Nonomuraea sp. SBT364]|uniref:prolyl aminopeptidase n=1 Tax=Nonomuraea sp. SBT364 TaxID=1580530 RepID=UPI00066BCB5D|nr:prolyl aminopeptidase [Nonomuraea sp. SBT364]
MYPRSKPYDQGMLAVGDGNLVHWEVSGNPAGKPAVVVHGGPGSGAGPGWRRFFDPEAYRLILFDQRGCGRSTPDAADPDTDLSVNTTDHLLADMELLREHLGVDRWQLFGGSWGTTLGLAYAVRHPDRVTEVIMSGIATTRRHEVDWITRGVRRYFPEEWERFRDGVPEKDRDGDLADAYARLLADPDPAVRDRAARDWCRWEDTHVRVSADHEPDPRYEDDRFRMRFARLVTHYWRHAAWLPDDELITGVERLGHVPGVLVHGRVDLSTPLQSAWDLSRAWPGCELVVVEGTGHSNGGLGEPLVAATDRFAR